MNHSSLILMMFELWPGSPSLLGVFKKLGRPEIMLYTVMMVWSRKRGHVTGRAKIIVILYMHSTVQAAAVTILCYSYKPLSNLNFAWYMYTQHYMAVTKPSSPLGVYKPYNWCDWLTSQWYSLWLGGTLWEGNIRTAVSSGVTGGITVACGSWHIAWRDGDGIATTRAQIKALACTGCNINGIFY